MKIKSNKKHKFAKIKNINSKTKIKIATFFITLTIFSGITKIIAKNTPKEKIVSVSNNVANSIYTDNLSFKSIKYFKHAGTTPLAPHVGAVTIIPPDAFSSLTA